MSAFDISSADDKTKGEAKQELRATLAISFLPLGLGLIAVWQDKGFATAFFEIFLTGNLYFYAMSICAVIFVLVQIDNKTGNVGMRLWTGIFVLFCTSFMAFHLGNTGETSEENLISLETLVHGIPSILFLLGAVWLNYRVLVISNSVPPPEDINRDQAQELADGVEVNYDA